MRVISELNRMRRRFVGQRDLRFYRAKGMTIGSNVQLGPDSYFDPPLAGIITIGDDVVFAPRVAIIAHDASMRRRKGLTKLAPVTIGDRVFVGACVTILPGVTIGDDAVIGAGSLVTRDIPAGMLAVGHPARPVRPVSELEDQYDKQVQTGPRYAEDNPGGQIPVEDFPAMREAIERAGYGWRA